MSNKKPFTGELTLNQYGFIWGNCLVERLASNYVGRKFQVLRIHAPNGEGVDIIMTPRTLRVQKFGREAEAGKAGGK